MPKKDKEKPKAKRVTLAKRKGGSTVVKSDNNQTENSKPVTVEKDKS